MSLPIRLEQNKPHDHSVTGVKTFKEQQKDYFTDLLGQKWECDTVGHSVCVPTVEGQHYQLSDEDISSWVEALCVGEATTAQPPDGILPNGALLEHGSTPKAVSVSPSRRRNASSSALAASNSLRERLENSSLSSRNSSGVPGPGYYGGKGLKWLGVKTLTGMERIIIWKRTNQHLSRLKQWGKLINPPSDDIGPEKQRQLFKIIEDALEMSRSCYSSRVNQSAAEIGWRVLGWCSFIPVAKETAPFLAQMRVFVSPLPLISWSNSDPAVEDLAWELREAIIKVPLTLQNAETTSAVIRVLARELAYSLYASQHWWLGHDLALIVETTLLLRPLLLEELQAIRGMALRRLQAPDERSGFNRSWEVVVFAECASQDSWYSEVVLGPRGLQSLIFTLDALLSNPVFDHHDEWTYLGEMMWALQWLSLHGWVARIVEPLLMYSLIDVMRRRVPDSHFNVLVWAIQTISRLVSYRPEFIDVLVEGNAAPVLKTLTSTPMPLTAGLREVHFRDRVANGARRLLDYMTEPTTPPMQRSGA